MNSFHLVETLGMAAGILLLLYGVVLAKLPRYEPVDDWWAWAFSTVGFVLVLIATNYVLPLYVVSLSLRLVGYLLAAVMGTVGFLTLTRRPDRFNPS